MQSLSIAFDKTNDIAYDEPIGKNKRDNFLWFARIAVSVYFWA